VTGPVMGGRVVRGPESTAGLMLTCCAVACGVAVRRRDPQGVLHTLVLHAVVQHLWPDAEPTAPRGWFR
jgi:hypothetical protein